MADTNSDIRHEGSMRRVVIVLGFTLAVGVAAGVIGDQFLSAQRKPISRVELLKTDLVGMEGKEAHMWIAEIEPGAATGKHYHPTPRFVYVLEGSVTVEVEGKPPHTFRRGEAFQELPNDLHNFRNGSATEAAKALGFQIVEKGQPLQY